MLATVANEPGKIGIPNSPKNADADLIDEMPIPHKIPIKSYKPNVGGPYTIQIGASGNGWLVLVVGGLLFSVDIPILIPKDTNPFPIVENLHMQWSGIVTMPFLVRCQSFRGAYITTLYTVVVLLFQ